MSEAPGTDGAMAFLIGWVLLLLLAAVAAWLDEHFGHKD